MGGLTGTVVNKTASLAILGLLIGLATFSVRALYDLFTGDISAPTRTVKILTYNVCQRGAKLQERMKALGALIVEYDPDVLCFQEVTKDICNIFEQCDWWRKYDHRSDMHETLKVPFFCMQLSKLPVKCFSFIPFKSWGTKKIHGIEIEVLGGKTAKPKPLVIATSHLKSSSSSSRRSHWKSASSGSEMTSFIRKRVAQAKQALSILNNHSNVIFCGDMNWDEESDGDFPVFDRWVDAWTELRTGEKGWTFDPDTNPMLHGKTQSCQKRLDRFICNLRDFKVVAIDMVGKEPPVFVSDHYGLLLEVQCK